MVSEIWMRLKSRPTCVACRVDELWSFESVSRFLNHSFFPRIGISRLLGFDRIAIGVALELAVFLLLDVAVQIFD